MLLHTLRKEMKSRERERIKKNGEVQWKEVREEEGIEREKMGMSKELEKKWRGRGGKEERKKWGWAKKRNEGEEEGKKREKMGMSKEKWRGKWGKGERKSVDEQILEEEERKEGQTCLRSSCLCPGIPPAT